jgi:hypothetical protein
MPRLHGESFLSSEAVTPGRFNFAYKQALSPLKPICDRTDHERSGLGQRALEEWNIREPSRAEALRRGDAGCHSPAWQPGRSLREAASRKPCIRPWLSHEYIWVADVIPPIMISNLGNGRMTVPSEPLAGATRPLDPPTGSQRWPAIWSTMHGPQTQIQALGLPQRCR